MTYPSSLEGFGNAFLEAIYYRKPLVMSAYEIFKDRIAHWEEARQAMNRLASPTA